MNTPFDPDSIRRDIKRQQRIAAEAMEPSSNIERLMLQILGGWSRVAEDVVFLRHIVRDDALAVPPRTDAGRLANHFKMLGRELGVRIPDKSEFTRRCKPTGAIRNNLGHMLYIKSITGSEPNRSVEILTAGEMNLDEANWAKRENPTVTITEYELKNALADLKWLSACIFAIRKIGVEWQDRPDESSVAHLRGIIPWTFDDWDPTVLKMRDLRADKDVVDTEAAIARFLGGIRRVTAGLNMQQQKIANNDRVIRELAAQHPDGLADFTGSPENDVDYYVYELGRLTALAREISNFFKSPPKLVSALTQFELDVPKLKQVRNPLTHLDRTARLDKFVTFSNAVNIHDDGTIEILIDPIGGSHHEAALKLSDTCATYLRQLVQNAIAEFPPQPIDKQIESRNAMTR